MTRRRVLLGAATAIAAAVAWLATTGLPWPARAWTAVLLTVLPVVMTAQAAAVGELRGEVPRSAIYVSSAVALWGLAAITVIVTWGSRFGRANLRLVALSVAPLLGWAGIATAAGLGLLVLSSLIGVRESEILRDLLPATVRDRASFVGLSVTAGVAEELVFRGFLLFVLTTASGSTGIAVVLSSAVFGVAHAYQDVAGCIRAAALGALLAGCVLLSGSIFPAMLAHGAIDVLSGLWLSRWLLRR